MAKDSLCPSPECCEVSSGIWASPQQSRLPDKGLLVVLGLIPCNRSPRVQIGDDTEGNLVLSDAFSDGHDVLLVLVVLVVPLELESGHV